MIKLFIFSLWIMYPDGKMDIKASIVPECPSQEEFNLIVGKLKEAGEIKAAMATCEQVPMREAAK